MFVICFFRPLISNSTAKRKAQEHDSPRPVLLFKVVPESELTAAIPSSFTGHSLNQLEVREGNQSLVMGNRVNQSTNTGNSALFSSTLPPRNQSLDNEKGTSSSQSSTSDSPPNSSAQCDYILPVAEPGIQTEASDTVYRGEMTSTAVLTNPAERVVAHPRQVNQFVRISETPRDAAIKGMAAAQNICTS